MIFSSKIVGKVSKGSMLYRPGQPNWEYTLWIFQDFSTTWISREINFGHFKAPKNAILTI